MLKLRYLQWFNFLPTLYTVRKVFGSEKVKPLAVPFIFEIAVIAVCAMLFVSALAIPDVVEASFDDSSMVFDLGLSGYNSITGTGLSNNVVGGNTVFTVSGTSKPALNSLKTLLGAQTKYLTFKTIDGGKTQYADREISFVDPAFLNQEALTVSFWMRQQADSSWDKIFRFASNTQVTFQLAISNTYLYLYYPYTLSTDTSSLKQDIGKWRHIVMTRKDNPVSGKQDCTVYMNGVKTSFCQITNNSGARVNESDRKMFLGNFCGDISDVKIYTKAMGQEDVTAVYNATRNNYLEDIVGIDLESASIPSGDISSTGGDLELNFSNVVDENTISGITMTKENGDLIRGYVRIYTPEKYSKKVIVRYGELEVGESYRLRVPAGIGSINGYFTDMPYEYIYKSVRDILFYEDFEGEKFVSDEECPPIMGLYARSSGVDNSWKDFMVHTDSKTGSKYIDFVTHPTYNQGGEQVANGSFLSYNLPVLITDEPVAFEMKFRCSSRGEISAGASGPYRLILNPFSQSNLTSGISFNNGDSSGGAVFVGKNDEKGTPNFATVSDKNGWYVMKMITGVRKSDGKRYFDYYYDTNNPQVYSRVTSSAFNPVTIGSVLFGSTYLSPGQAGFNKFGVSFDYIKVFKVEKPTILYNDERLINTEECTSVIYFGNDMDEESLANSNIYFESDNGETIKAKFYQYNSFERVALVDIYQHFMYGRHYTLYLPGVKTDDGTSYGDDGAYSFDVPEYEVRQGNVTLKDYNGGNIVTTLGEAVQIQASVTLTNNSGVQKQARVFFQHYRKDGRIKSLMTKEITLEPDTAGTVISLISDKKFSPDDYVRIYAWDIVENVKRPLSLTGTQINYE